MDCIERLNLIKEYLNNSKNILNALCDENRQNILLVLLENCINGGIRVNDIAKRVNLSRLAVSHPIKNGIDASIDKTNKWLKDNLK